MKTSWSKRLFVASDILIAIYLLLAFVSFDKKGDPKALCSKVNIDIADNAAGGFLDAKVIKERLQKTGFYPIGRQLKDVDTRGIEEMLRRSPFVKTAECYKTEGGYVYISVTQRMPVIRIKADNGDDYYVDDHDCIMPRSSYTSDLIIATGYINRWYAINYISPLGKAIMQNDVWKNLIEQINITPNLGVELVPRIGDHIVYIGQLPEITDKSKHDKDIAQFVDKKMTRLEKFYKYGLSQVGWNKYSYVNIEFDNQIICKRKDQHANAYKPQPVQPVNTPDTTPAPAEDGPSEGETSTPATENRTGTESKKTEANKKGGTEMKKTYNAKKGANESKKTVNTNKKKSSN
ncbi:cell division protein FtsQ [uncultured Prevotella sp.]|uniref:cell division protein FtsQ/DivIB n=1 Tax=uncultured Prevotella sp. TaxID=159272 RepID=UPI0025CD3536|nr:cell division protein FtsQ [uncultured Prevotella sp.]